VEIHLNPHIFNAVKQNSMLHVRAHFGNANAAMGRLSLTAHVFHSERHMRKHKGMGFDVLTDKFPCSSRIRVGVPADRELVRQRLSISKQKSEIREFSTL